MERDDGRYVLICAETDQGNGIAYMLNFDNVTEITIRMKPGPTGDMPYVEVWRGDHLYAISALHQCKVVEFI